MPLSFVGSQVVEISPGDSISPDFSSLTGGTIQSGDVGYVLLVGGLSTSLGLINWVPPAGWVEVGAFLRNPGGALGAVGRVWERPLDGTETTETFTDSAAQGKTILALATAYRDLSAVGLDHAQQQDPASSTSSASPYTELNPTDVTGTIATLAHSLGTTEQLLLYTYLDFQSVATGSAIVRSATDGSLNERIAYRLSAFQDVFVAWFDETWVSAADLPSRAVSTHWSSGTGVHSVDMVRIYPTRSQAVGGDVWGWGEGAGDAWAWVG